MMTGYAVDQLIDDAVDSGALGVFDKPVAIENLFALLEKLDTNSNGLKVH